MLGLAGTSASVRFSIIGISDADRRMQSVGAGIRTCRQHPPFLRSSNSPKRPRMLLRARSFIVPSALALLAACGSDGPVEPVGGEFSLGQSVSVESGRDARVLGGTAGGTFVAAVVNVALDSVGQSSYSLRATGIEAADQGPFGPSPRLSSWTRRSRAGCAIASARSSRRDSPPRDGCWRPWSPRCRPASPSVTWSRST